LPHKKENPNFIFFQKLTEFMGKKKHCLLVSIWIARLKEEGGGGRAWVWSNTHARVFFLTLQRPAHSGAMGNLKFFRPISLFFLLHLYVLGVFGLDEICRAGLYFVQNGQITRLEILLKAVLHKEGQVGTQFTTNH
jgi:hypothetical protein